MSLPDLEQKLIQECGKFTHSATAQSSSGNGTYEVTVSRDGTLDRCDCPGYQFRRNCKHVTAAREKLCSWREDVGPEKQTPQQEMEAVCPRCGSETAVDWRGE